MLGVSFDSPEANRRFVQEQSFPFRLLSDVDRKTALAYRAAQSADDAWPRRVTYVIGPDGRIERAIETRDPGAQAGEILAQLPRMP